MTTNLQRILYIVLHVFCSDICAISACHSQFLLSPSTEVKMPHAETATELSTPSSIANSSCTAFQEEGWRWNTCMHTNTPLNVLQ